MTRFEFSWLTGFPARLAIAVVRFYQVAVSPLLGSNCRFTPTCSSYFIRALERYGLVRGSAKGIWRILRCHPLGGSGHDPP